MLLVSLATRLEDVVTNDTYFPSALIFAVELPPFPCVVEFLLIRLIAPVCISLRKISHVPFVSPATRLLARLPNTTYLPSALIDDE